MHNLEILLNVDSDSVAVGWGFRFCISNMFPGDNRAAGLQTTFSVVGDQSIWAFTFPSLPCISGVGLLLRPG